MSHDMKWLKRRGICSGDYKPIFSLMFEDMPKKTQKLVDLISEDIRNGRYMNFKEWRAYRAIDLAWDMPGSQIEPTVLHSIAHGKFTVDEVKKQLDAWGLSEDSLLQKVPIKDKPGLYEARVNLPVLFNVMFPLVKSVTLQDVARLFNEVNTTPFMPYRPKKGSDRNEVACEIVTDMIDTQSEWYGYPASVRQGIFQTKRYGLVLGFPREEWHYEEAIRDDGTEKGARYTVKEGLRYIIPDPTRLIYDLAHPLTTINSDSGCEFYGHWEVKRYSDILDDPKWWNRTKIFGGTNWYDPSISSTYFEEFFPCSAQIGAPACWGVEDRKRENKLAWYSTRDRQRAVFVTNYYRKIIPSQWGLGRYKYDKDGLPEGKLESSYDYPVWHRFVVASDDTIIWAEPCAYVPGWFMGHDYDEQSAVVTSLSLDVMPFQHHLTNILSQIVLTALQNLGRVVFYDTNLVNVEDIRTLKNLGEERYRSTQFIGFDSELNKRAGLNQVQAFQVPNFQHVPITELMQLVPMLLNILDRILQTSAQDTGASGAHYQGKDEIAQLGAAGGNRRQFTASYIYEGLDAMQRQIYHANMAYRDDEVTAQVSAETPNIEEILTELGFTVSHKGEQNLLVTGKKQKLRLEGFASRYLGPQPGKEKELAQALMTLVQTISSQPELYKLVGGQTILSLLEHAAKLMGGPADLKLRPQKPEKDDQVPENVINLVKQVQQNILQMVSEKVAKPAAQEVAKVQQQLAQVEEALKAMQPIAKAAQTAQDKVMVMQQESQAKIQRENAAFQAEERRRDEEHNLKMKHMAEEALVKTTLDREKANVQVETTRTVARAKAEKAAKPEAAKT